MEYLSDLQRNFLEKEHLTTVVINLMESDSLLASDQNNDAENERKLTVTTFVEMCIEMFGNDNVSDNHVSTHALVSSRSLEVTNGLTRKLSDNATSSSFTLVQKCIRKYRQVMRRYYDLKSLSLDKYLNQPDLNTAREKGITDAMQYFEQIRPRDIPTSEQDDLKQKIKRRLAQEYQLVQTVNEHKKLRFINRVFNDLTKHYKEKLENRCGFLFNDNINDPTSGGNDSCTKLRFVDKRKLEIVTGEAITATLKECKEYLDFSDEQQSIALPDGDNSHADTAITRDEQALFRLKKIRNGLLHKNEQILQKARTFLHSHLEDSAADCHVGIDKALEADPFLKKETIHDNLIAAKKRKYVEEFCTRVVFTDDNTDFQMEFESQLNARITKVVDTILEKAMGIKMRAMRRFEGDVQQELHELVYKVGRRHGIDERQMTNLKADLMDTAKRCIRKIQESVGVKTTKWVCKSITPVMSPPNSPPVTPASGGAFSVQLTFTGLRIGFIKNQTPYALHYITSSDGDGDTITTKIPLVAGLTHGSPCEFVFGHEVEEKEKQNMLRLKWNLEKMLNEKQHCNSGHFIGAPPPEKVKFYNMLFNPTLELLLGAVLRQCKRFCRKSIGGGKTRDEMESVLGKCVISVPPRFLPFQRQQMKDAARIAGFDEANIRIFNESACCLYHAGDPVGRDRNVGRSPKSPSENHFNSNSMSDDVLVISQYTDNLKQMKFDFVQYKRSSSTKRVTMEHYIDEEVITQTHLNQCNNCNPNSTPNPFSSPSGPSHFCEALKNLQGMASMDGFLLSVLQEALSHTRSSSVTNIVLNCEHQDWEKVLESTLPQFLPNMTIKQGDGVKRCGEVGVLLGLINMGKGQLWDIWISNRYTRSSSIWTKNKNGSVSGKLGGYKANDKQESNMSFEGQLICSDNQVSVHFGLLPDKAPAQEDVDWGTLRILKEIPQSQTICVRFMATDEWTFKPVKVDFHQVKQAQQSEFLSTLKIDKDYTWETGNLTKEHLERAISKVGKLLMGRAGSSSRSSSSSSVNNKPPSASPPQSSSSSQPKRIVQASTSTNTCSSDRERPVKRELDNNARSPVSRNTVEKKVRFDL